MLTSLIKPYLFKLIICTNEVNINGGCVIFKSSSNEKKCYLLTAKHNFFNEDHSEYTDMELDTNKITINVSSDNENYQEIEAFENKVFFIKNQSESSLLDIALIIIDSDLENILDLKVYDTFDEQYNKHIFYTAGYPYYISETDTEKTLQFYAVKPISKHKNEIEAVINPDGSLNFYDHDFPDKLKGMSGSGVFLLGKNREIALRSIIYKAIPTNQFDCIKVDEVLDKINQIITNNGFSQIQVISKPLSINDELFNLSDLANIEELKNFIQTTSNLEKDIKTAEQIRKKAIVLNKEYHDVKDAIDQLSFKYSHLALLANDEKMQLATIRFFKKAINLNSEHITAFLLQKDQKNKSLKEINKSEPKDFKGIYQKYNAITQQNSDLDDENKITLLKEAIEELSYLTTDAEIDCAIDEFSQRLEKLYQKNKTIKMVFKLDDLAKFFHKVPQKQQDALHYNHLVIETICLFLNPKIYNDLASAAKERISYLEKSDLPHLSDYEIQQIKQEAKHLFQTEEDQSIKEILEKISHELTSLNSRNVDQEDISKDIINSLTSIYLQNNQIEVQTQKHQLDIQASNNNTIELKEILNKIPEKYEIQLDDTTRNELLHIAEEPLSMVNATLQEVNQVSIQTRTHIDDAEKSLKVLSYLNKQELEDFHHKAQITLEKASEYHKKLINDKDELLVFLKRFENRIISNIQQIFITTQEKDAIIRLIQQSIAQLNNNLKTLDFHNAKKNNKYFYFSKQNDMTDIQYTCLDLENKIAKIISEHEINHVDFIKSSIQQNQTDFLEKIISVAHHFIQKNNEKIQSLTDIQNDQSLIFQQNIESQKAWINQFERSEKRLKNIQSSQLRFENNLLEKTKEALMKYPKIIGSEIEKPHFSFKNKVLLWIYFSIITGSIIYLAINHKILDLLVNLWQTALQQLNP